MRNGDCPSLCHQGGVTNIICGKLLLIWSHKCSNFYECTSYESIFSFYRYTI